MSDKFARWFRALNANLITTNNFVLEKLYKFSYFISVLVYKKSLSGKSKSNSRLEIIDNFDSDIRMHIDTSRTMGAVIYWTGFHEFRELLFLHRFLKPDMVLADVGANQGEFTLFAAKRLTKGKVLAFEPLPSIHKMLADNVKLNDFNNILLYDFGLSEQEGSFSIHEFEGRNEGLATLFPGDREVARTIDISLKKLDNVFQSTSLTRLDFVKMDIEGGELAALKGAQETIQKFKPVFQIEINTESYNAAGYTVNDILKFLKANDYEAFSITKRGGLKLIKELPAYGNIIFQPK